MAPPPPIAAHALLVFLLQVGLLLSAALLLGRLANRLGTPAVVGELCAGVLFGPTVLGHLAPRVSEWLLPRTAPQFHLLDAIGQIGVVLFVGVTGIEVDFGLVRRKGTVALRVGVAGLAIPLAAGVIAGLAAPRSLLAGSMNRDAFALFVGVAMCVSALPVIAKTLSDMNLLHRNIGQLTIAAGVVDDVVGWLLLSIVSAMATAGVRGRTVASSVILLAIAVLVTATVARPLVRAAFARCGRSPENGPTIATAVLVIVLSAAATQAMGFEAAFGAFLGGLLIGSANTADLGRLAPLRAVVVSVFAPLFFATAGLRVDLTVLTRPVPLLTAVAALLIAVAGKFAGAYVGALSSKLTRWEALALAGGMNARGVIQIVVATVGLNVGVLDTTTYTIVILVAITTSLMAPPILRRAMPHILLTEEETERRRTMAAFRGPLPSRDPDSEPA
ncbi:Kef-type K+ transport system membrane component KefB [Streptomyces griseochromogenes]|uniref:Kef-type K+ transport system membrane component KefB n=1 Tax=Streptomyces griseochromogenes TaxID=68214 RepID=A0A1B1AY08_9ACTN|nr:cation:proton antiporter [Streptomyces griseochromogenes]ANP51459.1 sodium:proton exchanger [Streptomyces griseochromogenes]MBP2049783.1 Kef-type K+ transport system membrane component KefB [Streptomyces griseochromogenes]